MIRRVGTLAGLLALLAAALPASDARAQDPGRTVLAFLELSVGARAAWLGDAYVSVTADATVKRA